MSEEQESREPGGGSPCHSEEETLDPHTRCLLAMARAVHGVGMYGETHASSQGEIRNWLDQLSHLFESRGSFAVGTDGQVAFVDREPLKSVSPVMTTLLRKLHASRTGILELRDGFNDEEATALATFLAAVDPDHLAGDGETMTDWLEANTLRHVNVEKLTFHEVRDSQRVVHKGRAPSARRGRVTRTRADPSAEPKEAKTWARSFKKEGASVEAGGSFPREMQNGIVDHLRGTAEEPGEALAYIAKATEDLPGLGELVLKTALIEQELGQRSEKPVGHDVVACLEKVLSALQETPEAQTEEGLNHLLAVLKDLEQAILARLQDLTGGTDEDARIVRSGVEEIEKDIKGTALQREYSRKRRALQEVERRIRQFFGTTRPIEEVEVAGD